jgi:hypothetical protein
MKLFAENGCIVPVHMHSSKIFCCNATEENKQNIKTGSVHLKCHLWVFIPVHATDICMLGNVRSLAYTCTYII